MAKHATLLRAVLTSMIVIVIVAQFRAVGMIHAMSRGDLGIHLTNAPFDEPVKNVSSIISVDNSYFERQEVPKPMHSVFEGDAPAANKEEASSSSDEWEKYSFVDIYDYFDCRSHARNKHKPLYTPKMWALIRKVFAAQAGVGVLQAIEAQAAGACGWA